MPLEELNSEMIDRRRPSVFILLSCVPSTDLINIKWENWSPSDRIDGACLSAPLCESIKLVNALSDSDLFSRTETGINQAWSKNSCNGRSNSNSVSMSTSLAAMRTKTTTEELWSLSQCQPSRKSNCTSLASGLYELHWLTIMPLGWYESHQVSILIPAEFGTLGTKLHLSVKSNIQSKGQKLTLAYPPNWFSAWSVDWNRLSSKVNSSYHHAFKACLPITKAGQPIEGKENLGIVWEMIFDGPWNPEAHI